MSCTSRELTFSVRLRGSRQSPTLTLARGIVQRMRNPDGKLPRYYQILLAVKSMDDTPIEILYRLHKELPGMAR